MNEPDLFWGVRKMLELNKCYNMDCVEGMAQFPDGYFDLAVVDPPYGRKEHGGKNRGKLVTQRDGSRIYVEDGGYSAKQWDMKPPPEAYFRELCRVSKRQIIWGVNYFPYAFGPGRIVWDKCNGASDQSDCEIAYNSMTERVDLFRFMWAGMMQGKSVAEGHIMQGNKSKNEKRIHPTQKPVALYTWIFSKYAREGEKILDTHLGSGSSRIAAYDAGLDFIGFELDHEYFSAEEQRFEAYISQTNLFHLEQ